MKHTAKSTAGERLQRVGTLLGVVALAAFIVMVRPPEREASGRTEITMWAVTGSEETEPQAPKWFNAGQDEIELRRVTLPFLEIEQKFLTSCVAGIPPDVFEYFGSVVQWSTRGALMPLNEFIERDGFDTGQVFPALWEEMSWDRRIYAIPTGTACDAFYWNKALFREAGLDPERPPATWDEMLDYAAALTKTRPDGTLEQAGYIPGYWRTMAGPLFMFWSLQGGAEFLQDDGRKIVMASEPVIEAFEFEKRLFEAQGGYDALSRLQGAFGEGRQHGFLGGRVAMMAHKSNFVQEIEKFAPELEYGASMFPVRADGQPATVTGPAWIGIPAGAKHPEAAWEFIKFYTSTDVQRRSAEYLIENAEIAFFPANMPAAQSPKIAALPHMEVFIRSMDFGHTSNVAPLVHTLFWREFPSAWQRVMSGQEDASTALEKAEKVLQSSLEGQLEYNLYFREKLREEQGEQPTAADAEAGSGRP